VRQRLASTVAEAGRYPTFAPASPEVSPNPRSLMWAAASFGRRRSLLRSRFWPGSSTGFMLQLHESPITPTCAGLAVPRFDGASDHLHASGKGRHQNLFRPAASRRSARGLATRAVVCGASAIGKLERAVRTASGQFHLPELRRHSTEQLDIHQSRVDFHRGGVEPACASHRYRDHDGRRSIRGGVELHNARAGESRHSYRVDHNHRPVRAAGVQREFRIPCHPSRREFSGQSESAASHATLTTACTAGGLHGG
jgi:hypothetical protein